MFLDRSTSEAEAESDKRPDWGMAELIVAKHRNVALARHPTYLYSRTLRSLLIISTIQATNFYHC